MRILGYARRSTDEQPTTLDAQLEEIGGWATAGGHELVDVVVETISGTVEPEDRPVLGGLLDRLAAGEADALVITTTDRCARTTAVHRLDYYGDREGWALLLAALERRTSPEAQLVHGIRVNVAAYERALIARRTRAALAYRKSIGVRIGRPRRCPDDVLARVLELRAGGARLVDVAAAMNVAGVPTPGGGAVVAVPRLAAVGDPGRPRPGRPRRRLHDPRLDGSGGLTMADAEDTQRDVGRPFPHKRGEPGVRTFHGPVMCEITEGVGSSAVVAFTGSEESDILHAVADYLAGHRFAVVLQLAWHNVRLSELDEVPTYRLEMTVDLDNYR